MTTEVDVSPVPEAAVPDPDAPAAAAAEGAGKGAKSDAPAKGEVKEVPKPDKPRLPKPDRASLESAIAELQEAADEKQARIEQLKRAIETRRDARKNVGAGSQETKSRIAELNSTFSAHMVRPRPRPAPSTRATRAGRDRRRPAVFSHPRGPSRATGRGPDAPADARAARGPDPADPTARDATDARSRRVAIAHAPEPRERPVPRRPAAPPPAAPRVAEERAPIVRPLSFASSAWQSGGR